MNTCTVTTIHQFMPFLVYIGTLELEYDSLLHVYTVVDFCFISSKETSFYSIDSIKDKDT